jgi:hypothetical protein
MPLASRRPRGDLPRSFEEQLLLVDAIEKVALPLPSFTGFLFAGSPIARSANCM